MIGGTLAQLDEPTDERLETDLRDRNGIDVRDTQETLGANGIAQSGVAVGSIDTNEQHVEILSNPDGERVGVHVEQESRRKRVVSDWVADVTGTGVIAAASTKEQDPLAFPFDVLSARAGVDLEQLWLSLPDLVTRWDGDGPGNAELVDVWLSGTADEDRTEMLYHDSADMSLETDLGLGFKIQWDGTYERGVAYESGYVALYTVDTADLFLRFINEEILPVAINASEVAGDDEDDAQQTLADQGGDDS